MRAICSSEIDSDVSTKQASKYDGADRFENRGTAFSIHNTSANDTEIRDVISLQVNWYGSLICCKSTTMEALISTFLTV